MNEPEEPTFDMDGAVSNIADSLGFGKPDDDEDKDVLPDGTPEEIETESAAPLANDAPAVPSKEGAAQASEAAVPRAAPKSWAKEYHDQWGKLDPAVQEYFQKREDDFHSGLEQYRGDAGYAKELRDIVTPYKPMLAAMGVDEKQAVQYLLNAQFRLSNGTPEQRLATYQQIGRDLGLVTQEADPNAEAPDPAIASLRAELNDVKSALTQRQQMEHNTILADANKQTETFASDPANPFFQEVANDMVPFIGQGLSLKDAYEKAVWANPVTRQKLLEAQQTEAASKLEEKTRAEGEAAKRAAGQNVRGVESRKAPTEPKGSMDDTMRSTLKSIKARTH